jgi:Asp-tRNA(Asn)/Glu-tRNA(Gln) amidotransferase A subunit family amidase
MPHPFDTPLRALLAVGFILVAAVYLAVAIATDGLASAAVPAVAFAVIGFCTTQYLLSRDKV